eukprot:COSAG05_NODE_29_length_29038_cov_1237.466985_19_plen_124_part_00
MGYTVVVLIAANLFGVHWFRVCAAGSTALDGELGSGSHPSSAQPQPHVVMTEACMICRRQIPLEAYDRHGEECVDRLKRFMRQQKQQAQVSRHNLSLSLCLSLLLSVCASEPFFVFVATCILQ